MNVKYEAFSNKIVDIIDHFAPLKSFQLKDQVDQTPWVDLQLA